jgi:hypothetical protein
MFMKMKDYRLIILLSVLALVALVGVTAFKTASAASHSTGAGVVNYVTDPQTEPGRGGGRGGGYNDEDLATALGISVDDLTAAYQKATDEALSQAVADELITQKQADAYKSRGNGKLGNMVWLASNGIDYEALLAKALGISTDELKEAYQKARLIGVDRAVTEGKMTQDQADLMKARQALAGNTKFQEAMQAAYEAAVNQAVTDGVITQEQADLILKANESGQEGKGIPGIDGFPGFGGGMPGHGGLGPKNNDVPLE